MSSPVMFDTGIATNTASAATPRGWRCVSERWNGMQCNAMQWSALSPSCTATVAERSNDKH